MCVCWSECVSVKERTFYKAGVRFYHFWQVSFFGALRAITLIKKMAVQHFRKATGILWNMLRIQLMIYDICFGEYLEARSPQKKFITENESKTQLNGKC